MNPDSDALSLAISRTFQAGYGVSVAIMVALFIFPESTSNFLRHNVELMLTDSKQILDIALSSYLSQHGDNVSSSDSNSNTTNHTKYQEKILSLLSSIQSKVLLLYYIIILA